MRRTLARPLKSLGGKDWTFLDVRDHLTAGDLLAARRLKNADPLEQDMIMIARDCGIDPKEAEDLDYVDMCVIQSHIQRLILAGAEAAEASAPKE